MLNLKSHDGTVDIYEMEGTSERIVSDLGAATHKTLLLIANDSKSKEEVFIKYGTLVRELVDYLKETVRKIDDVRI